MLDTALAACYRDLAANIKSRYGAELESVAFGGFSAMMHGYIALDSDMIIQ